MIKAVTAAIKKSSHAGDISFWRAFLASLLPTAKISPRKQNPLCKYVGMQQQSNSSGYGKRWACHPSAKKTRGLLQPLRRNMLRWTRSCQSAVCKITQANKQKFCHWLCTRRLLICSFRAQFVRGKKSIIMPHREASTNESRINIESTCVEKTHAKLWTAKR